MATPEHGTVGNNSQSVMYSVLSSSSGVTDLTENIYDGDPYRVARTKGVPFIIIEPPTYSTTKITQTKWMNEMRISLDYRTYQESVLRQLDDAIVKTLVESESTFITNNMVNMDIRDSVKNVDVINNRNTYGLVRDVYFEVDTKYY